MAEKEDKSIHYETVRVMKKFFYHKEKIDEFLNNFYNKTKINEFLTDKKTIHINKNQIDDFPSSISPSAHTHSKAEITDFPSSMVPSAHTHKKSDITDFPSSMAPTAHTHKKSDITDFTHTHKKSEITDFTHTHKKSEITDFPITMPPSTHTHSKAQITDFPSSMAPTAHTHKKSDITDFAHTHKAELVQSFSDSGVTVNVYANDFLAHVTVMGNAKNIVIASQNYGVYVLQKSINDAYRLFEGYMIAPATTIATNHSKIGINSSGNVYILNATDSNSLGGIRTAFTYPLI